MSFSRQRIYGHSLNLLRQNAMSLFLIWILFTVLMAIGFWLDDRYLPKSNPFLGLLSFTYIVYPYFIMLICAVLLGNNESGRLPLAAPLRLYIAAFIAWIMISIASSIGLLLLIVPGLLILGVTTIVFPVLFERINQPVKAIQESVKRCMPYKWSLAVIQLLLGLIILGLGYAYAYVAPDLYFSSTGLAYFTTGLISALYVMATSILAVAVYDLLYTDYLHDVSVFD